MHHTPARQADMNSGQESTKSPRSQRRRTEGFNTWQPNRTYVEVKCSATEVSQRGCGIFEGNRHIKTVVHMRWVAVQEPVPGKPGTSREGTTNCQHEESEREQPSRKWVPVSRKESYPHQTADCFKLPRLHLVVNATTVKQHRIPTMTKGIIALTP